MDAYKNAVLHKDRAALAKLVSDDIMYVHSSGTKYETKADLLKSIRRTKTSYSLPQCGWSCPTAMIPTASSSAEEMVTSFSACWSGLVNDISGGPTSRPGQRP